ncbi:hypothetical protein DFH07DRAFT_92698 [Mycena maculata]|uniref:HMG box domain-containing protein n=1 Tax=Mycena maculata TaxID=230809 RepID=A0AAD7I912_9AGAR|nr:hypothetical protein DFH07DRAFT_92698 [Mycena maculata]
MPPIREHQILYTFLGDEDDEGEHTEEDEDMPPLVDPPPATQESMMSSFDFGGVAFGAPAFAATLVSAPDDRDAAEHDADANTSSGRGRKSRAAQRAAPSYIPRPPNAFILFRSSFIRSQNVPGRVEGNHSTLSKIIGKYWHALPPEERARWEDKARAAQAEHRRRYPDWRFRPGNGKDSFFPRPPPLFLVPPTSPPRPHPLTSPPSSPSSERVRKWEREAKRAAQGADQRWWRRRRRSSRKREGKGARSRASARRRRPGRPRSRTRQGHRQRQRQGHREEGEGQREREGACTGPGRRC